MNKKNAATAFLLSLLCLTVVGSTFAQTASVGVHQGNMFKYSLVVNWISTNPNDTVPTELFLQNRTEYFQINVQTVTNTTVWIEAIMHYSEEYAPTSIEYVDVNTGDGNSTFVYAANLAPGNYLFPGSTSLPWAINETVPRYYQDSGWRQTNHISVNRTDIEGQTYSLLNLYFDQATGMVVESYYTYVNTATPQQTVTQHLQLTETNVWTFSPSPSPTESPSLSSEPSTSVSPTPTPEGTTPSPPPNEGTPSPIDPLIIVLIIAVVVVLIIAVFAIRRGGKKSQKQPSTQKPPAPATAATQTKLTCSKCGQENPKGSEFCNKCGTKLPD